MPRRPRMSGKILQKAAIDLAHQKGYMVAHFRASRVREGRTITAVGADGKGFPDLLLVGPKVVAVEVKGDGDYMRPEQKVWLETFEKAGVPTLVLTPKAWLAGELEALL
jgi:hypothetical protein